MMHKFKVGDHVIFTNDFGVCWGVKTITALAERNGPTYHYEPTDTPWFSSAEGHFQLADEEDLGKAPDDLAFFQEKYGFVPTETYGCW